MVRRTYSLEQTIHSICIVNINQAHSQSLLPELDVQLSQEWYNMGRIIYSAGGYRGRVT